MFLATLKDWICGNVGVSGDYLYKSPHLWTLLILVIVTAAFCYVAASKKISPKAKKIVLWSVSIFQLVFELTWRIIFVTVRDMSFWTWWPEFPCNLNGILLPILALTNWKTGKKMFYVFGFLGGVLTFLNPVGIFTSSVISFPILKSILQHTGLIIIPMYEWFSKEQRCSIKDFLWLLLGMVIIVFYCEVLDRWLGFNGDYLFLRSDLPFVIPGVPQWITMGTSGLIVLFIFSILGDLKVTKEFFSKKKAS